MKDDDIFKMLSKVVASFLTALDYLDGYVEVGQALREEEPCFTAADYHYFLKVSVFAFFEDSF